VATLAMTGRFNLSDAQWAVLEPLLPKPRSQVVRRNGPNAGWRIAVDALGMLLAVVITAVSAQDRDAARPLLWNRACRRIRLIWADAVYTGKLSGWAPSLKMAICIMAGATRTPSGCCSVGGLWSGRSPGSAKHPAPPATTSASRPATKPWSCGP
jgi:hypothetical protein